MYTNSIMKRLASHRHSKPRLTPRGLIRRYWVSGLLILLVVGAGAGFLWYQMVKEQRHVDEVTATQAKEFAEIDRQVAASLAAKKAAEEAKQRALDEAKKQLTDAGIDMPKQSSTNDIGTHGDPSTLTVIVNKKHPINPINFTPSVVSVTCAGNGTAIIRDDVKADFTALCDAAAAAGVPLGISSSYRSYTTQISTYNYWVGISGKAGADTYSARPGYSEHQTGLSVDFSVAGGAGLSDFTGTPQQKWLAENAWKYGFIQRYTTQNSSETGYNAESWHFRYLGRALASDYTKSGTSSLESYWGVSGGDYPE